MRAPRCGVVQLRVQKRGFGAAWFLASIEVAATTSTERTLFPFHGWIQDTTGWQHTLLPEGHAAAAAPVVEYAITVSTSDLRGAGVLPRPLCTAAVCLSDSSPSGAVLTKG